MAGNGLPYGKMPRPNPTRHLDMRWDAYLGVPDPDGDVLVVGHVR
ncbi:hypothetical protein Pan216_02540 [Planctomycetes bacterium Pan216]|uniref:Uncharacterized protein n=1 Tax=Kolteria novifilia TaxID=2527975 RepID=A0A518AXI0_9BACT|nr:hypothetical protein Pan216_02540 [Planctomycetes bacterium Pan216]